MVVGKYWRRPLVYSPDRLREDVSIPPANLCEGATCTGCCASNCGCSYSRTGDAGILSTRKWIEILEGPKNLTPTPCKFFRCNLDRIILRIRSNIILNLFFVTVFEQVAKVARKLAGKGGSEEDGKVAKEKGSVMVMTLLEGGTSSRQKAWLKVWSFIFL